MQELIIQRIQQMMFGKHLCHFILSDFHAGLHAYFPMDQASGALTLYGGALINLSGKIGKAFQIPTSGGYARGT